MEEINFLYTREEVEDAIDEVIAYTENYSSAMNEVDKDIYDTLEQIKLSNKINIEALERKLILYQADNGSYTPFRINDQIVKDISILLKNISIKSSNPSRITTVEKELKKFRSVIMSSLDLGVDSIVNHLPLKMADRETKQLLHSLKDSFLEAYENNSSFGTVVNRLWVISQNLYYEITQIQRNEEKEAIKIVIKELSTQNIQIRFYEKKRFWFVYKLIMCPNYFMPYLTLYGKRENHKDLLKDDKTTYKKLRDNVFRGIWSNEKADNVQKGVKKEGQEQPSDYIEYFIRLSSKKELPVQNQFFRYGFAFKVNKKHQKPINKLIEDLSEDYKQSDDYKIYKGYKKDQARHRTKDATPTDNL